MPFSVPKILHRGQTTTTWSELVRLAETGSYLFHGTANPTATLNPNQPINLAQPGPAQSGIYASDDPDYAIFMSLAKATRAAVQVSTYRADLPVVCAAHPAMLQLLTTSGAIGHVHVCPRERFEELHPREFMARNAIAPIQIIPFSAADLPTVVELHDTWPAGEFSSLNEVLQRLPKELKGSAAAVGRLTARPV